MILPPQADGHRGRIYIISRNYSSLSGPIKEESNRHNLQSDNIPSTIEPSSCTNATVNLISRLSCYKAASPSYHLTRKSTVISVSGVHFYFQIMFYGTFLRKFQSCAYNRILRFPDKVSLKPAFLCVMAFQHSH